MEHFHIVLILLILATASHALVIRSTKTKSTSALFAGKSNRYSNWEIQRQKEPVPALEEIYDNLDDKSKEMWRKTGQELRSNRERDLKKAHAQTKVRTKMVPIKERTFDEEDITAVITALNKTIQGKAIEDLLKNERMGFVDWRAFHEAATELVPDYDNEMVRRKTRSWIRFHKEKEDIIFNLDTNMYEWDSASYKKRALRKRVRVVVDDY